MRRFIEQLQLDQLWLIGDIFFRSRWQKKQDLASPARYYGDGGTIHATGFVDVETYRGEVVAVWFRCQPLPFEQERVDKERAAEMKTMSLPVGIAGVEVLDR